MTLTNQLVLARSSKSKDPRLHVQKPGKRSGLCGIGGLGMTVVSAWSLTSLWDAAGGKVVCARCCDLSEKLEEWR